MQSRTVRRRIRPSFYRVSFATLMGIGSVYIGFRLLDSLVLTTVVPGLLLVMTFIGVGRILIIRPRLPQPYGGGAVTVVGTRAVYFQGILVVVGGVLLLFAPFIALFDLPGLYVVVWILVVAGGIPLSDLPLFLWSAWLEGKLNSEIYSMNEFSEEGGKQVQFKSIVFLKPGSDD